jgi:hypothetical protein
VKALDSTNRLMGHREQMAEREKKRKARIVAVEDAMGELPLKPGAEAEVSKMSGMFEQAHHAAVNRIEDKPATTRVMEVELKALAKGLGNR